MTGLFFDVLRDTSAPYAGFGDALLSSSERLEGFRTLIDRALDRLKDGFALDTSDPRRVPAQLDEVVGRMWREGWSPKRGNVGLFAQDFGLALASAVIAANGGEPVFRPQDGLTHFSLWWQPQQIEAFPFHCTIKCLLEPDGTSLTYFFRSLSSMVEESRQITT